MSKFVNIIVGAIEVAAFVGFVIFSGGLALAAASVWAPLFGALLTAGAGQLLSGVGTLIAGSVGGSAATGGITTASRNPIAPWQICYGQNVVGGTIIHINSFKTDDAYLDLVMVVAAHPIESLDNLYLDKQIVQLDSNLGAGTGIPFNGSVGDSFSPAQQVASIQTISRANGVVTVVLNQPIPLLYVGDRIKIQGITGDYTLNGTWPVAQMQGISGGLQTFTYISGGPASSVTLEGQAVTLWPDYGKKIHIEVLKGNQTTTFNGMLNGSPRDADYTNLVQDPNNPWGSTAVGYGKAMVWLRLHYDATVFSGGIPSISFGLHGKNDIYDPRLGTFGSSGTTAYTNNAALCVADYIANQTYGLKAIFGTEIPTSPLTAAANVCEEAVTLAAGGTEPRYCCDGHFDLSLGPGRIVQNLLTACAGRLSYSAGQFIIQPGAWYGSTPFAAPGIGRMSGPFRWKSISGRDLYNGVKGMYISPSNNWQPGDIPPYAQDSIHGYTLGSGPWSSSTAYVTGDMTVYAGIGYIALANNTNSRPDTHPSNWAQHYQDINVAADLNERHWLDIQLPFTISPSAAQRICKIELLRRRQFVTGTFRYDMSGYAITALDVIQMTVPELGWTSKNMEVTSHRFTFNEQTNQDASSTVLLGTEIDVQSTDSSIYDWNPNKEELTPQAYQQATLPNTYQPEPPTNLVLESDSFTATTVAGLIRDSIVVYWTAPADAFVTQGGHIEIQYRQYFPPVTTGTVSVTTSGAITFSSPVLQSAFLNGTIVISSSVFSISVIASTTTGTCTPSPSVAITAAAFVMTQNPPWIGLPSVNPSVTNVPIANVVDGQQYQVQIRSVNAAGVPSDWVVAGPVTATGARAPFPWQPGAQSPISSDTVTADLSFSETVTYSDPDANGNVTPQVSIGGFYPPNRLGIAAAPDVSAASVAVSSTGGSLKTGTYILAVQAYDNTSSTRPGSSLPSLAVQFTVGAGITTGSAVVSGFVFAANTQGYRVLVGLGTDEVELSAYFTAINPGSLPSTISITSLPPRTFGPTDPDADHFHVQAFDVQHWGPWLLQADGPLSGATFHLPGAVGFSVNQFQGYTVELMPGPAGIGSAVPIAHGTIASHDAAGNFTLANAAGWSIEAGDWISCNFKLSTATDKSFSDANVINAVYPSGNATNASKGAEAWVLVGGTVQQIQTVESNDATGWVIKDVFDPPITTASRIVIVYPATVYDSGPMSPFSAGNDNPALPVPTIATIALPNQSNNLLIIRVFIESVDGALNSNLYPVRPVFLPGQAGASGAIGSVTALSGKVTGYAPDGTVAIQLTYKPNPNAAFQGIEVQAEEPDFSATSNFAIGISAIGSDSIAGARMNLGRFRVGTLDASGNYTFQLPGQVPPTAVASWRFYALAYGSGYVQPLVPANQSGASPSVVITVNPTAPVGLGSEYAPQITNLQVGDILTRQGQGSYEYNAPFTWDEPVPGDTQDSRAYGGVALVFIPIVDEFTGLPPIGLYPFSAFVAPSLDQKGSWSTGWKAIPGGLDLYKVYGVTQNTKGQANTYSQGVTAETSFVTPVIDRTAPGGTNLPDVTGFNVISEWVVDGAGNPALEVAPEFTAPASGQMWGSGLLVAEWPAGSGLYFVLGSAQKGDGTELQNISANLWPTTAPINVKFWLDSVDANGNIKYPTLGTFGTSPTVTITIPIQTGTPGSATEFAPLVTGASATLHYGVNQGDGNENYYFTAAWTDPTGNLFKGLVPEVVFTGGTPIPLGVAAPGDQAYQSGTFSVNDGATGVIYLVSADGSGRRNDIVPGTTPGFAFTISVQTTGSMAANRLKSTTLNALAVAGGQLGPVVGGGVGLSAGTIIVATGNGITNAGGSVAVNPTSGLAFVGSQIGAATGDGAALSSGLIIVSTGDGIHIVTGSVAVNAASGIGFASGTIYATLGNGLTNISNLTSVNPGGGINTGSGTTNASTGGGTGLLSGLIIVISGTAINTAGSAVNVTTGSGITTAASNVAVNSGSGTGFSGSQLVVLVGSTGGITTASGQLVLNLGSSMTLSAGQLGVSNTWVYNGAVACTQLTAGTISATILLTSASLQVTASNFTLYVDASHAVEIVGSSGFAGYTLQLTANGLQGSNPTGTVSCVNSRVTVTTGSSTVAIDSNTNPGLYVGSNRVVGPRQTGPGTLSGAATNAQIIAYCNFLNTINQNHGLST